MDDVNQAEPPDFVGDLGAKRAVTHEQRLQLRAPAICVRHRADEVQRILMPDQLRHLDDQGTVRRYAASGERRGRRRLDGSTQVDAVRHHGDPGARDSACDKHVRYGVRDGDDPGGAPILPAGAGIPAQREVHAAGDDERHARAERSHSPDRDGVRGVGMNHVDSSRENLAPQPPCGSRIQLADGPAVDDGEARRRRARRQRFTMSRSDDGLVAALGHFGGEPERLSLAATPSPLRVDVQHADRHGAQLPSLARMTQASSCFPGARRGARTS